jgi:cytochrome c oxidase subunit II
MPGGVRRIALLIALACVAVLGTAAVAYAGNPGGFMPSAPHSPNAHRINQAYIFICYFTGFILVVVEGALITFIIKYRRGRRARTAEGQQIHGSTRLEIIWTVIPVLILAAIGSFVFYKLPGIADAPKAAAADETTIRIEGHQYYWRFVYPNGAVSIGTMVAPAGEVVKEDVVGLTWDVNHSWWVPSLGGKYDAIPGKTNHTWFQAPVGDYVARCAELCGIQHALMDGDVKVVPRQQYEQFVSQRAASPQASGLGKEEFQGVCMTCHRLDHKYVGPALGSNPLLHQVKGLTTILRQGIGNMPAVGRNWTNADIQALVAYTKTLTATNGGNG